MFGGEFEVWKLHSFMDYLYFFLMVIFFATVTAIGVKAINKGRNDKAAQKRVGKRLKIKEGKVYSGVTFDLGGEKLCFDHLIVDAAGIVAVRCIGRGLKIYGTPEDAQWKIVDNKGETVRIDNPVKELEASFDAIRRHLAKDGLYRVGIDPLVVFADPFAQPELYLGRDSSSIIYDDVKKWVKNRRLKARGKAEKLDWQTVAGLLDKAAEKD